MKRAGILLLVLLLLPLVGCISTKNEQYIETSSTQQEKIQPSVPIENPPAEEQTSQKVEKTSETLPAIESLEFAHDYGKAYYAAIQELSDEFGFYENIVKVGYWDYDSNYEFYGFCDGRLMDFDKDGIPELIVVSKESDNVVERTAYIYRFDGEKAEQVFEMVAGNSIYGDNVAYIEHRSIENQDCLWVENCDWGDYENIKAFTIENGVPIIRTFNADETADMESGPQYDNCKIDGESVSTEAYLAEKERYQYVDWCQGFTKEEALEFIETLKTC